MQATLFPLASPSATVVSLQWIRRIFAPADCYADVAGVGVVCVCGGGFLRCCNLRLQKKSVFCKSGMLKMRKCLSEIKHRRRLEKTERRRRREKHTHSRRRSRQPCARQLLAARMGFHGRENNAEKNSAWHLEGLRCRFTGFCTGGWDPAAWPQCRRCELCRASGRRRGAGENRRDLGY